MGLRVDAIGQFIPQQRIDELTNIDDAKSLLSDLNYALGVMREDLNQLRESVSRIDTDVTTLENEDDPVYATTDLSDWSSTEPEDEQFARYDSSASEWAPSDVDFGDFAPSPFLSSGFVYYDYSASEWKYQRYSAWDLACDSADISLGLSVGGDAAIDGELTVLQNTTIGPWLIDVLSNGSIVADDGHIECMTADFRDVDCRTVDATVSVSAPTVTGTNVSYTTINGYSGVTQNFTFYDDITGGDVTLQFYKGILAAVT